MTSYLSLALSALSKMPENPNVMSAAEYSQLCFNIRVDGCSQSLLVRRTGENTYDVIDGAHRFDACTEAGLVEVPCIVVDWTREKAITYRLAMNKIRGNPNLTDVGRDLRWLVEECGVTPEELAMTGYQGPDIAEILAMTRQTTASAEEVLANAGHAPEDLNAPAPRQRHYIIEIPCNSAGQKKALTKALRDLSGGKGQPLVIGLASALGVTEDDESKESEDNDA